MGDSSNDKQRSSSSLSNQSDDKNINGKRKYSHTQDETSTNAAGRKKYNVINEDVRKKIIKKLTEDNANIKEVAQEYGLKLSTCKAILQVYQKEGRIGKKATRDRKSKIVSTILVTRIDPMNPSISTITPYIHITEAKTASKKGDDNAQTDLIKEAFKNAQDHVKSIIQQNSQEIYFGHKVPSSCKRDLEGAFLEAQRDAIKNLLRNNPLPSNELNKQHSSPDSGKLQGMTGSQFSAYSNNQIATGLVQNQLSISTKSIEGTPSQLLIQQNAKHSFKQQNSIQTPLSQSTNNVLGLLNQASQLSNNADNNNQQLGLQQYDTTSLSNNIQENEILGIQESQKKIKSQNKIPQKKNQPQQQQQQQQQKIEHMSPQFAPQSQPGVQLQQQQNQQTSSSLINQYGSFSGQNISANGYPNADASLILDQYNQNLKNNSGWNDNPNYSFNNIYSPKQTGFNYTDSPTISTMNASPAITPFLNPFSLNSPQLSGSNNYASSFLSPLNLALNSTNAPPTHKPSQFSLNSNYTQEDITKKQFISKDNQRNKSRLNYNYLQNFFKYLRILMILLNIHKYILSILISIITQSSTKLTQRFADYFLNKYLKYIYIV